MAGRVGNAEQAEAREQLRIYVQLLRRAGIVVALGAIAFGSMAATGKRHVEPNPVPLATVGGVGR